MRRIFNFLGITISSAAIVIASLYYLGYKRIRRQNELENVIEDDDYDRALYLRNRAKQLYRRAKQHGLFGLKQIFSILFLFVLLNKHYVLSLSWKSYM